VVGKEDGARTLIRAIETELHSQNQLRRADQMENADSA
jgi:hypothetical protein